MAVGGVDHQHVAAGVEQRLRAAKPVLARAGRGGGAEPAVLVLAGVRELLRLLDILDGDEADAAVLVVDNDQLLDADGLGGDDIPMFARIIAIADAFVAMTSDRPYRGRLSRAEAVGILRQGAGKQWDAALVERFLPLIEKTDVESASQAQTAG